MPDALSAALAPHGLILRGGFHPEASEAGLEDAATVLLVGNAGPAMWSAFEPYLDGLPDPLNRWTHKVLEPIAAEFAARVLYPFGEPAWPFQRWAQRAEPLHPSPLGLLIHPDYGLWHAWRGALLFRDRLPLAPIAQRPSPCETCAEKPCLVSCPVGAFSPAGYHVPVCAGHLSQPASLCPTRGCRARDACPIGRELRYPDGQIRFHMAAFAASVRTQ
jgi:hypothetical protein